MPGKAPFLVRNTSRAPQNLPEILFDMMFPMFQFTLDQTPGDKDKTLVVYGGTFSRRMDVDLARLLEHKGLKNVVVMKDYSGLAEGFSPQEKARPGACQPCRWGLPACWNGYR